MADVVVEDPVEAEGDGEGEGGEEGDAMEVDEAEGAGAKQVEGASPAKARKKSEQVHQPSQFEQIVDLKISDLPCGWPLPQGKSEILRSTICSNFEGWWVYLAESVGEAVLQKPTSTQSRQLILHCY